MDVQQRFGADPDFDPTFALLSDYRQVTAFALSDTEVRRVAARTPFQPSAKRALVMVDAFGFGMARMFQIYSDLALGSGTLRVFQNYIDAAMRWISEMPTV